MKKVATSNFFQINIIKYYILKYKSKFILSDSKKIKYKN